MSCQSELDRQKEPDTDAILRMGIESVRPNREKIRSVIERRLQEERRNPHSMPSVSQPFFRWALAAGFAAIVLFVSYSFLFPPSSTEDRFVLLPMGKTFIGTSSDFVSEPKEIKSNGQTIETMEKSYASLVQTKQFTLRLNESTSIQITRPNRIQLMKGSLYSEIEKRSDPSHAFAVTAGDLTATVLGTQFSVDRKEDRIEVAVREGRVQVSTRQGESILLTGGESVVFSNGKIGAPTNVLPGKIAPWSQALIQEETRNQQWRHLMQKYYGSRMF